MNARADRGIGKFDPLDAPANRPNPPCRWTNPSCGCPVVTTAPELGCQYRSPKKAARSRRLQISVTPSIGMNSLCAESCCGGSVRAVSDDDRSNCLQHDQQISGH